MSQDVIVSVESISRYYGRIKALDEVSFELYRGEILGFLGPNGAGKSTMMRILTGFLMPSSGVARVCGYDVVEDALKVRRCVGYLSENNPLYEDMDVIGYLRFIGGMRKLKGDDLEDGLCFVLEKCGLMSVIRRRISSLSKGYRQRVGLAQALIHRPSLLILDEASSGLDPIQLVEIRELIKEVGINSSVIFSTHILQEVEVLCDRLLILSQGKVCVQGSLEKLRKSSGVEGGGIEDIFRHYCRMEGC